MRILLDECLPRRLKRELPGHDVRTTPEMGWAGKRNGELLRPAESDVWWALLHMTCAGHVPDYAIKQEVNSSRFSFSWDTLRYPEPVADREYNRKVLRKRAHTRQLAGYVPRD